MFSNEEVARVCHEASRALQHALGDPAPAEPWDAAPDWQREVTVEGVRKARMGMTPRQLHEEWARRYREKGWAHGMVKDWEAKTHPCLLPYDELPDGHRVKDVLFQLIVTALTVEMGSGPGRTEDAPTDVEAGLVDAKQRELSAGQGYGPGEAEAELAGAEEDGAQE